MATIKDVAQEAGLAVSTVSRILNNRGYISEDARRRVDEAMKKLDYQPNELARSLHRKNSNLIGLIVPHIKHPYFTEVISRIEDQAYKKGYRVLLCNSQTMQKREKEYVEICKQNRVAGIIMCTGRDSLKEFENLGIPVVGWERYTDSGIPVVECDNVQGGILAAEHLIGKGCKNILHFGTILPLEMPGDHRYEGMKKVCDRHGVECHEELLNTDFDYMESYEEEIMGILKQYPDVDGIFANNDILAAQTIRACRKMGIKVPDDIKVMGYDDVFFNRIASPSITSIKQPITAMAEHAVTILDHAIHGKAVAARAMFPVKLMERESTL